MYNMIPCLELSAHELRIAFSEVWGKMSEEEILLVRLIWAAGADGISATTAAKRLNKPAFRYANLIIARIGNRLLRALNASSGELMKCSSFVVAYKDTENSHWRWVLCDNAREALSSLKL